MHAFGRMVLCYVSRPLAYDPQAIVFTKTPTTIAALFRQRLRWNSSRIQDIQRWTPSNSYHWQVAFPVGANIALTLASDIVFLSGVVVPWFVVDEQGAALPISVLAAAGYVGVRTIGTFMGLLLSECKLRQWISLAALPLSGVYHLVFNTLTTIIGVSRDLFWCGEPTSFSPERTLRRSGLSRVALAYRVRRALLLACRALVFGDVPLGWFWLGWRETPWTRNGFAGWSSRRRPSAVCWPRRDQRRHGVTQAQ